MQNTNRGRFVGGGGALEHNNLSQTNINTHTYTRKKVRRNHRVTGVKMKLQHRE